MRTCLKCRNDVIKPHLSVCNKCHAKLRPAYMYCFYAFKFDNRFAETVINTLNHDLAYMKPKGYELYFDANNCTRTVYVYRQVSDDDLRSNIYIMKKSHGHAGLLEMSLYSDNLKPLSEVGKYLKKAK